jgi:hypothetical protein
MKKFIAVAALKVLLMPTAAGAECQTHACKVRVAHRQAKVKKLRTIAPYRWSFLGPVGACESGTGSYSLRVGLRAISPGGKYRGRYQFGWPDWLKAGGHGDPAAANWLDQAFRAVVWLHMNGRGAWPNC